MAMEMRGALNFSRYYSKPNQPKYYGKCLINGVEYEIKGWEKVRQDTGEVWVSLLFEDPATREKKLADEFAPAPQPVRRPISAQRVRNYPEIDDDIPF